MADGQEQVAETVSPEKARAERLWHFYLTGEDEALDTRVKIVRGAFKHLPSAPRCKVCRAPFRGIGSAVASLLGFGAGISTLNPSLCDRCETIAKKNEVGMELELTMLFADVRGSTALAQEMGVSEFHHIIDRFYKASTDVLVGSDALIEKLIGDEVAGLYVPGIAGSDHAKRALEAARQLLEATGHADPDGPWIRVGVAVHTGSAYVGSVGSSTSMSVITVLGDAANTTARLASEAGPGEILVSEDARELGRLQLDDVYETRSLELKGRNAPIDVHVLRVPPEVT